MAHTGNSPSNAASTLANYGAGTAVSAMTVAQLSTFYFYDSSLSGKPLNAGLAGGMKAMLADGRLNPTNWQIAEDAVYVRQQLGIRD